MSVPQCQEAHQESHQGASEMGHVADVPGVLVVSAGHHSVVDGPGDVAQDEEGHHHHLQGSQSLPVNSVHSSVQPRPEIQEDGGQ